MQNLNLSRALLTMLLAGDVARVLETCRDRCQPLMEEVQRQLAAFLTQPVTPEGTLQFEKSLADLLRELGRVILEVVYNSLEPEDPRTMPKRMSWQGQEYSRKNRKTNNRNGIGTLFGKIVLRRFSYEPLQEARDDQCPSIAPLEHLLGIVAANATPALGERLGALAAGQTQGEVRATLEAEYNVGWSVDVLRAVTAALAGGISEFLHDVQKSRLLEWLREAHSSRGRYKVVFCVGRDGIMVPIRGETTYKEAAVATLSIHDRRGRRLGTIYLGQMPEEYQSTLSEELTALIRDVLSSWTERTPRLVYVTDAGYHPTEYFENVLAEMVHPRHPGQQLEWTWIVDFYHAAGYVSQLADVLFEEARTGHAWSCKMRHWLQHKPNAVFRILHSAAKFRSERVLSQKQEAAYSKAYNYLQNHKPAMDYREYRRLRLPIGSGVTEAACKVVFTQRFKESGMSWKIDSGRTILTLRLARLSGVWETVYCKYLAHRRMPEPATKSLPTELNYQKAA